MTTKTLKHIFQSAIADGPDTSLVRPSNWNAEHNFYLGVNAQTGTTYTMVDGDDWCLVHFTNAASIAVTLPQAGASSQFISGWVTFVRNLGAGTVTITPTTSTIDGAASITVKTGESVIIFSNGTNYYTMPMVGAVSPTFTGTPAAPTAASATNTTQIATTAFVRAMVAAGVATFIAVAGTAATPAFSFTGDTTTGLYSPTSGGLSFTSGGTEIWRSTSSTFNIGRAGVTNPAFQIDYSGGTSATGVKITANAAASRAGIAAISSGTDEGLSIDAKGAGTIRLGATSTGAVEFSRNAVPTASDGAALGTTSLMWSDLFLASGGVLNWNNGDVTLTHSANTLTFGGAASGYRFDAAVAPSSSDGAALGTTALMWSDLFLAWGAAVNFYNGDLTLTHSSGVLTCSGVLAAQGLLYTGKAGTATGGSVRYVDDSGANKWMSGIGAAGSARDFLIYDLVNSTARVTVDGTTGGVQIGAPTGGDKGVGTLNAVGVYDDNVLLTDYVFDKFEGLTRTYSPRVQERYDDLDEAMFDVKAYAAFWRENGRLYGMPDFDDCIDGRVKNKSLGAMSQLLWQTAELHAIHIASVDDEVTRLKARVAKLEQQLAA